ncbi:hypothetical protein JTB14_024959 [Gonioctena quinquepunctata]|nr:hypothetical protein JTB14_024959 [Gonioctena quinquepunctata]
MLSYSIPELDIFLVEDPVICESCITSLEAAFKFKTECLRNEEKLLKHSENAGPKIDLQVFAKTTRIPIKMKENNNNREPDTMKIVELEKEVAVKSRKEFQNKSKKNQKYPSMRCQGCVGCKKKLYNDPRIHSKINIGPFECYTCHKEFSDIQILRKHVLNHVKQRKCKICYKMFRDLESLRRHFRVHTQISPYTCELCQKQFRQKHNLSQHLHMHSGSAKVSCTFCHKAFSTKYNAKVHMENTHKTKEVCDLCGETFCTKAALVEHLQTTTETCGNTLKIKKEIEECPVDIDPQVNEGCIKTEPETVNPDFHNNSKEMDTSLV